MSFEFYCRIQTNFKNYLKYWGSIVGGVEFFCLLFILSDNCLKLRVRGIFKNFFTKTKVWT
jgi:hypothetical protein